MVRHEGMFPKPTLEPSENESPLDPYAILGIEVTADARTIQRAYIRLARRLHPDRQPSSTNQPEPDLDHFQQVAQAASILRDSYARAHYDQAHHRRLISPAEWAAVCAWQRRRALAAQAALAESVRAARAQTPTLLILKALYGDARPGRLAALLDCTAALQLHVHHDQLILGGGPTLLARLDGLFDPIPGDASARKTLYVRYRFAGQMHECVFLDHAPLRLPREEHRLQEGQRPWRPSKYRAQQDRSKEWFWCKMFASGVVLGVATAVQLLRVWNGSRAQGDEVGTNRGASSTGLSVRWGGIIAPRSSAAAW